MDSAPPKQGVKCVTERGEGDGGKGVPVRAHARGPDGPPRTQLLKGEARPQQGSGWETGVGWGQRAEEQDAGRRNAPQRTWP